MSIRRHTDYLFMVIITFGIAYMVAVIVGDMVAKQHSAKFFEDVEKTRKVVGAAYASSRFKQ